MPVINLFPRPFTLSIYAILYETNYSNYFSNYWQTYLPDQIPNLLIILFSYHLFQLSVRLFSLASYSNYSSAHSLTIYKILYQTSYSNYSSVHSLIIYKIFSRPVTRTIIKPLSKTSYLNYLSTYSSQSYEPILLDQSFQLFFSIFLRPFVNHP